MFSLHERSLRLTYLSSQLFYQLPYTARSERSISHEAVQHQSLISGSKLGAMAATCNVKKVANFYTAGNLSLKSYSTSAMSPKYPMLEKLGLLSKEHVKIKDLEATEAKIQKLVDGGSDSLQVVADFDYTLTRVHGEDGKRYQCSWGVLDSSPMMPQFYRDGTRALLDKYYPIEVHATMTEEEKIPHVVSWYTQAVGLLARCDLHKDTLTEMVSIAYTCMREGVERMFTLLRDREVPVLVFSAGMGDILVRVLDRYSLRHDNVKIVSNFFKYDDKGMVSGFDGDMIHVFNKNESSLQDGSYFAKLSQRTNVMLMGDSLGDVKMTTGLPDSHNILRIGYLNLKMERLPAFQDSYDIVLLDDQTVDMHLGVLELMQ